jgi:hypothetical protein
LDDTDKISHVIKDVNTIGGRIVERETALSALPENTVDVMPSM